MKTILIFINSMNASGGIERVVSNLAKEWIKKYNVFLLVKDYGESYYPLPNKIKIIHLDCPQVYNMKSKMQRIYSAAFSFLRYRKQLKKVINKINPDFIYTTSPLNSIEVFALNRTVRSKLIVSEHGSYYAYNRIYKIIKRLIYPKVKAVSVPNKMDTAIYKQWGCNAVYIPHILTFSAKKQNSLNTKILINVGRLTADKQQDRLIKIWNMIPDHFNWCLWIVGDGEEKQSLMETIRKLNLEETVKVIPARKDIEIIYKQASLFSFTSKMEGFGMVLLEAMAFGIPCISFDCPSGPRDIIENGVNGLLISNDDDALYAKELERLIKNRNNQLNKLGDNAYKTIVEWNNEMILSKWYHIFS